MRLGALLVLLGVILIGVGLLLGMPGFHRGTAHPFGGQLVAVGALLIGIGCLCGRTELST